MTSKKISEFSPDHRALADFAAALAHPARIAIIKLLQKWGEAHCGKIVEALPLSQATVSQHLHCLNRAGLLKQRQCGKRYCYSIDCERVREFCHNFQCTLGTADEAPAMTQTVCCAEEAAY